MEIAHPCQCSGQDFFSASTKQLRISCAIPRMGYFSMSQFGNAYSACSIIRCDIILLSLGTSESPLELKCPLLTSRNAVIFVQVLRLICWINSCSIPLERVCVTRRGQSHDNSSDGSRHTWLSSKYYACCTGTLTNCPSDSTTGRICTRCRSILLTRREKDNQQHKNCTCASFHITPVMTKIFLCTN